MIRTDHISYSYPRYEEDEGESRKVLDGVDLEVRKGQFICILGSNGSGKSTLARHLNALLYPGEGTVWIDGIDSTQADRLWDIRSGVGMVFQNPDNQIIAAQVEEEVAFGPENLGVPSEQIAADVQRALQMVGMESFAKDNPGFLSGGQKQRIAVAGILAMKPKCIVLDESTAMLDPAGRKEIMNTVLQLNRERQITLICITHFMEEALQADHIFVMQEGKIVLQGTPKEIFSARKELEQAGLVLPVICRLAEELRKKGMQIPSDVITEEELRQYLQKAV